MKLLERRNKMDNQKLTYYIPSEPDYYSPDCTDEEAKKIAMIISEHIQDYYPDIEVEIVKETFSNSTRNRLDNPIVCIIENDINENLYKWLK